MAAEPGVRTPSVLRPALLWLLLGGAIVTGAILRFFQLGEPSLWIDEGFSLVHARAILEHGYPLLPAGDISWSYFPVHYLMALGLAVTRSLEIGGRLFPALAGTLLIPATFLLGRRVFRSVPVALVAAGLLAVCTYEVAWSRQARVYICLQLFSTVAVWAFYRFLDTRNVKDLVASLVACALAVATHRAGYLVPLVFSGAMLCEARHARSWWCWARIHRYVLILLGAATASFIVSLGSLASNSGAGATMLQAATDSGQQHAPRYLVFLWRELGLLPLWAMGGAVLASMRGWRRALPLILAAGLYFWSLSTRSLLFHFRYILPLLPIIMLFAAYAVTMPVLAGLRRPGLRGKTGAILLLGAFLTSLGFAHFSVIPRTHYALGYTAPQPDWAAAYAWVKEQELTRTGTRNGIRTVTTFPMFHDLYLGNESGTRSFLPFSRTGYPGEFQDAPRYSDATVVSDPDKLWSHNGWIILDDFGLRMLKDPAIRDALMRIPPTRIIKGPHRFDVFVWAPSHAANVLRAP